MSKLYLPPVVSGFTTTQSLNARFQLIVDAINNTLSRDGSLPNSMQADLDMHGRDILNIGLFEVRYIKIGGQTLDLSGLSNLTGIPVGVPAGGSVGQFLQKTGTEDFDTAWSYVDEGSQVPAVAFAYSTTAAANSTSTWMAAPGLSISITPQSIIEKIKLDLNPFISIVAGSGMDGGGIDVRLRRTTGGSTVTVAEWLLDAVILAEASTTLSAVSAGGVLNMTWVDSPSTESTCTYFVEFRPFLDAVFTSGTAYYNGSVTGTRTSTFVCMRCV